MPTRITLILVLGLMTHVSTAQQQYYSQGNGLWNVATTWNTFPTGTGKTGIPGPLDQVLIQPTHKVTVDTKALSVSALRIKGILTAPLLSSVSMLVTHELTIEAMGTLNATHISRINVGRSWEKQIGGVFIRGLSTVTFYSSTNQHLTGENTFYNLEKTGGGTLTLTGDNTVVGTLALTNGLIRTSDTDMLRIGITGNVSGGSVNSYIAGPLEHVLSVTNTKEVIPKQLLTRKFPFGSAGKYRPITLEVSLVGAINTVYYRGELHEKAPPSRTLPASIDHLSQQRYYTIDQSFDLSSLVHVEARVIINYNEDDGVDMPTDLRIIKSNDSDQWMDIEGQGAGAHTGGTISSQIFNTFSDFALASSSPNNPLPVTLLNFEAQVLPPHVQLHWTTLNETDNSHFVVERSADGHRFEEISTVAGAGTTYQKQMYRFTDRYPLTGNQYYRLKQVDFDGNSEYSTMVAARVEAQAVQLSPNPAQEQVTLSGWKHGETVTVQIINASGHTVHQQRVTSASAVTIPVDQYPAGIYQVVVTASGWHVQKKLMVH